MKSKKTILENVNNSSERGVLLEILETLIDIRDSMNGVASMKEAPAPSLSREEVLEQAIEINPPTTNKKKRGKKNGKSN